MLHVTRVLWNFPQLKQLNKITNTCQYCDLHEFHCHGFQVFIIIVPLTKENMCGNKDIYL